MKLYLGCGPSPVHDQHKQVMGNPDEWTFVDLYVKEPHIKNWDATKLDEVPYNSVEKIYCSHTLEHFEHATIQDILERWHDRLESGGELILNVPDLTWLARRIIKKEGGAPLDGYYTDWEGEHGLLSILYGSQSHEGEYHKGGFTKSHLHALLSRSGYENIEIETLEDAHDMGVLIARAKKPKSQGGEMYAISKKS